MTRSLIFILAATTIASAADRVERAPSQGTFLLWQAPKPMTESDWVWGPGGKDKAPVAPFTFLKENRGGTNPKVDVRDANGALWTVKFGGEVHTEVFASRLLQAAGYAAEATYYVADGTIEGATDLHRARPFIGKDGGSRTPGSNFAIRICIKRTTINGRGPGIRSSVPARCKAFAS
jgi:hypothetical protein